MSLRNIFWKTNVLSMALAQMAFSLLIVTTDRCLPHSFFFYCHCCYCSHSCRAHMVYSGWATSWRPTACWPWPRRWAWTRCLRATWAATSCWPSPGWPTPAPPSPCCSGTPLAPQSLFSSSSLVCRASRRVLCKLSCPVSCADFLQPVHRHHSVNCKHQLQTGLTVRHNKTTTTTTPHTRNMWPQSVNTNDL